MKGVDKLSDRIARVLAMTTDPDTRHQLEMCVEQAEAMEDSVRTAPNHRTTDPETSAYDSDMDEMSVVDESVLHTFFVADEPLDEVLMRQDYRSLSDMHFWMRRVDVIKNPTAIRKGRRKLERWGLLKRIDGEGEGPTGRPIGRYVTTMSGVEAAQEKEVERDI